MLIAMAPGLADRHCTACTPDTPTIPPDRAIELLRQLDGWSLADRGGEAWITRTVRFKGFLPGVRLVDRIAELAEAEGHHPDLRLVYGSLTIDLSTHAARGLTDNDFILAAKIDGVVQSSIS
jgi:4a-hydroxytetrahydrobiopterin dehydratase